MTLDRDRWHAVVNAVTNLRVLKNAGNFLTSSGPVSFSVRYVAITEYIQKFDGVRLRNEHLCVE